VDDPWFNDCVKRLLNQPGLGRAERKRAVGSVRDLILSRLDLTGLHAECEVRRRRREDGGFGKQIIIAIF
jgi:hypothetical protein